MAKKTILIRFWTYFTKTLMQIRYFSKVPYLKFFDFGSNKGLCPLFGGSTVFGLEKVPYLSLKRYFIIESEVFNLSVVFAPEIGMKNDRYLTKLSSYHFSSSILPKNHRQWCQ